MSQERAPRQPDFQPFATAARFLSDAEMDELIAGHLHLLTEGKLGRGNMDAGARRSQVVFLGAEKRYDWLYDRIWSAARECNRLFFGAELAGVEANIQLGRYESSDKGFYDWHTDFAGIRPDRKLSLSVQLSRSDDYDGGDLELLFERQPVRMDRTRGTLIAFPSFMLHRVAPVTRGTRWSLVAWILGPRWR